MGGGRKLGWGLLGLVTAVPLLSVALVARMRVMPPPTTAFMERAELERGA